MKTLNRSLWLAALAALAFGTACAQPPTPVEMHWGEAKRHNAAAMIANPDAGRVTRTVEGLDPITGELVMESYRKNQTSEEKATEEVFIIQQ